MCTAVCGDAWGAAQWQQDDLAGPFDPRMVIQKMPEATVFMGVPTLYVRMLAEPGLTPRGGAPHAAVHLWLGALLIETFTEWQAAPATPFWSATA
jgi:hypothetical protein